MSRSERRGFKLIELIVVLAIIAVLVALLLPGTRRVRGPAARMACANNLKNQILAIHNYSDTMGQPVAVPSQSRHPAAEAPLPKGCFGPGTAPEERLSWMVELLPYLEQDGLFKQFNVEKGYTGNRPLADTAVKLFWCPSEPTAQPHHAVTCYVAMSGIGSDAARRPAGAPGNGVMGHDRITTWKMIEDGTSNTIAIMEVHAEIGPWARGGASTVRGFDPADASVFGDLRATTRHDKGLNVALADASVRFITSSIDPNKLAAAITIAGGEPFNLD